MVAFPEFTLQSKACGGVKQGAAGGPKAAGAGPGAGAGACIAGRFDAKGAEPQGNPPMYEYKVVPAPLRAAKIKGLKTVADRFAQTLAERINAESAGGWQFVRTETLPCEERSRLGSAKVTQQVVMVFVRTLGATRPDAGAALAAVQGGAAAPAAPAPAFEEPYLEDPLPGDAAHDAPAYETPQYETPAYDEPEPQPEPPLARRQEPLFRSGALLRGDGRGRVEPVVRPRPAPRDGDSG